MELGTVMRIPGQVWIDTILPNPAQHPRPSGTGTDPDLTLIDRIKNTNLKKSNTVVKHCSKIKQPTKYKKYTYKKAHETYVPVYFMCTVTCYKLPLKDCTQKDPDQHQI